MLRAPIALVALALLLTGAALAAPVPVLTMTADSGQVVAALDDGESLEYSYQQSIYLTQVFEDFVRDGDRLKMLRARSADVRAVEYFRWDGEIRQQDGLFTQDAPASDVAELVIRITPGRGQTLRTPRWTRDLDGGFGDTVVRVRAERRPRIALLLAR